MYGEKTGISHWQNIVQSIIKTIIIALDVMHIEIPSVWSPQQNITLTEREWTRSDFDYNITNWHTNGDHTDRQKKGITLLSICYDILIHLVVSSLFPNVHLMTKRNPEKYVVKIANAQRMKTSAVPFQRLLNEDICKQRKDLSSLLQVNNGVLLNAPIT